MLCPACLCPPCCPNRSLSKSERIGYSHFLSLRRSGCSSFFAWAQRFLLQVVKQSDFKSMSWSANLEKCISHYKEIKCTKKVNFESVSNNAGFFSLPPEYF